MTTIEADAVLRGMLHALIRSMHRNDLTGEQMEAAKASVEALKIALKAMGRPYPINDNAP